MTHRGLGSLFAVAGCCLLAACAHTATSGGAEDTSAAKPDHKPAPEQTAVVARAEGDYGGIRPPKDLFNLPKDHELQATNPGTGERPAGGGVIVSPSGQPRE